MIDTKKLTSGIWAGIVGLALMTPAVFALDACTV